MSTERGVKNTLKIIKEQLISADNLVWKKYFPPDHRPDTTHFLGHVRIGDQATYHHIPHPGLKPEFLKASQEYQDGIRSLAGANKIAMYDAVNRDIVFSPRIIRYSHQAIARIAYHEVATDISNRLESITPDRYTDEDKDLIELMLQRFFPDQTRPAPEDTLIQKSGFRVAVMSGAYYIAEMQDPQAQELDEVYPTVVEILTSLAMQRKGDLQTAINLIQKGRIQATTEDDHPQFTEALYKTLSVVDWKDLLKSFKPGDRRHVEEYIQQKYPIRADFGSLMVTALGKAMLHDEQVISENNAIVEKILGTTSRRFDLGV